MDTAQWPQGIGVMKTMEIGSRHQQQHQQQQQQAMLGGGESRKATTTTTTTRPTKDHKAAALNCPRCNSSNTKFCYYNNYSLSQPRYFCKTCRRYWTEGGSLRNVPVGGGSRKNKRSSLSHLQPNSSNSTSSSQNPKIIHEGQDLNLAYPPPSSTNTTTLEDHHHHNYNNIPKFIQLPYLDPKNQHPSNPNNPNPNFSAMELLKTNDHHHGNMYSSSGFGGMQEFKQPTLSFSLDGFDQNGYGGGGGGGGGEVQQQNGGARLLFPFEDLKNVSSTTSEFLDDHHHNRGGQGQQGGGDSTSNGYWSGMLGGGSW